MRVSGIMVTRAASSATLRDAIGDFARQSWPDRELVIVHDGDTALDAHLASLCDDHGVAALIERAAATQSLGALRNRAVDRARGHLIAQWDDDDRHHPERLRLQIDALQESSAIAACSSEQLHWFEARGLCYWEDWSRDDAPFDVVQGTLVAVRESLPRYPAIARGEDSALVAALAARGNPIAKVAGIGWSYVYRFHGGNAWTLAHHAAIARTKSLSEARLGARESMLRARLADYWPPLPALAFPCGAADLEIPAAPATTDPRGIHRASSGSNGRDNRA